MIGSEIKASSVKEWWVIELPHWINNYKNRNRKFGNLSLHAKNLLNILKISHAKRH
jgi:hypothetical protein